jgi:hypothetical protein
VRKGEANVPVPLVSPELPPAASSPLTIFPPAFVSLTAGGVGHAARAWATLSHERVREFWAALVGRPAQCSLLVFEKFSFFIIFIDLIDVCDFHI